MALAESSRDMPCTYAECPQTFSTEAELRLHKIEEPDHYYCKKCDVDCASWVDLTQHKVDLMAPFLEGLMKGLGQRPKHIVCEFCGEDFKTFGGRKTHRETMHRADQSITCPGCSRMYVRASHMIEHLERNQCEAISVFDFLVSIQQKYIKSEVGDNPGGMQELMSNLKRHGQSKPPTITASGEQPPGNAGDDSDSDDGGISVRCDDKLTPKMPQTRKNIETWPRLPGLGPAPEALSRKLEKLSVAASTDCSVSELELPPSRFAKGVNQWSNRLPPQSISRSAATEGGHEGSTTPHLSTTGTLATFGDLGVTPENVVNLNSFVHTSNDFDVELFHDKTIDKYICPFPVCQGYSSENRDDIKLHFIWIHTKRQYACPACLKIFKKPSALIAHAESTTTCRIQQARQFQQVVDDISGGYLKAKIMRQPALVRPETDLVKAGQPLNGLMSAQFKGKLPDSGPRW